MLKLINKYCVFEYDSKNISIFVRNRVDIDNEPCIINKNRIRIKVLASDVVEIWGKNTKFDEIREKIEQHGIKIIEFNANDRNDTNK
jgi:hypothetical protein